MPLIILQTPFIRHYAGSVFALGDKTGVSGWDADERVRERLSFSGKSTWFLPDAGNGREADLPVRDTVLCPPEVFSKVDVRTGPCRITAAQTKVGTGADDATIPKDWRLDKEKVMLTEVAGRARQGIGIALPEESPLPEQIAILDRLNGLEVDARPEKRRQFTLDWSEKMPGFYHIRISCADDVTHLISVIKCFPLVVHFDKPSGRYSTMETVW